jgi:hypothetical protein
MGSAGQINERKMIMSIDVTGLGSVFDFGSKIIDKIWPNKDEAEKAKLALAQLQQTGELQKLAQDFELAKGQIVINTEESKSPSLFVSGWRPAIGWICGMALFYNYIFMPLFTYVAVWIGNAPAMPALESGELMTLLFGMLGLGGLRTYEKTKISK